MARDHTEIWNEYLGKHRRVSGSTRREVQLRAELQQQQWAEQEQRARYRAAVADAKGEAVEMTAEAEQLIAAHRSLLLASLTRSHQVDWEEEAATEPFDEPPPSLALIRQQLNVPRMDFILELLHIRSKAKRLAAEAEADAAFEQAQASWEQLRSMYEQINADHEREIGELRLGYMAGAPEAIAGYISLVLSESHYPESFPGEVTVFCDKSEPSAVIVELDLPGIGDIPQDASYRFATARQEIIAHPLSQSALADLYDGVTYQTALRVLHEVFDCDERQTVTRATVNLYVTKVNSATGADERICLATVETTKDQLAAFDLSRVEPRDCFRALKGLTAKRPSALSEVRPLRFIKVDEDDDGLAIEVAVDQQPLPDLLQIDPFEFEQLIGSLFQRIFEREGAAVEVTKASHDGGVDVWVDDPDEIKGGRTVIQVKRYKGIVSPTYVRDLYGTMQNERAAKGILVATGRYGPESREFAQDKPITLIDAEGLMKLLNEHNFHYRIDSESAPVS